VKVGGRLRSDNTAAANAAVARGVGIGFAPRWAVRDLVDRGEVEIILEDFEVARVPIHAVWLPTKTPLAKAQLFTDSLIARLKRKRL
jgi:DNA-binding transcriptional LysR family regulator